MFNVYLPLANTTERNAYSLTLSSSFCRSHTGNIVFDWFFATSAARSAKQLSYVDVAYRNSCLENSFASPWYHRIETLNPITENTTTAANMDVVQFVSETKIASL